MAIIPASRSVGGADGAYGLQTEFLKDDNAGIGRAACILTDGGVVAFPTETVYGLGGDARSPDAVGKIYAAKGRPESNPLIVHFATAEDAWRCVEADPMANLLASEFWPGPLTLVLPQLKNSPVCDLAAAGHRTLGVRVPSHQVSLELLRRFGGPVAAPSANRSGMVSPTAAEHAVADLDGRIEAVLDGGTCGFGIESTIVSTLHGIPQILRPGAITREMIVNVVRAKPLMASGGSLPASPGQLQSHYAPSSKLRLNAAQPAEGEIWIGFGAESQEADFNLCHERDLDNAAANLFAMLRLADRKAIDRGTGRIAVAPVPFEGIGVAINDRLVRAASRNRQTGRSPSGEQQSR